MVKVVLFDWGGVLADGGRWFASYAERVLNCTIDDRDELSAAHSQLSANQLSLAEFEVILRRATGVRTLPGDFWWPKDLVTIRPGMREYCEKLRSEGYVVGILSNMSEVSAGAISKAGGYDGFSPLVISSEVGASKPDKMIYDIAVDRSMVEPHEILYIDDHESNLRYPQSIGMVTVLADSEGQVISDVESLLGEQRLTLVQ